MEKKIHHGRNVKRFREMLGIKQEGLALELGDDWNQRKISLLEQKEEIEADLLKQVAEVLKVPVEAIDKFDEEAAVNIIAHTVNNHDNAAVFMYQPHFNPLDKVMELFERLLVSEREKTQLLKEILDKLK